MNRRSRQRDLKQGINSPLSALTDQQIEQFFSVNLKWLHTDRDFVLIKRDKNNSKQFLNWLETMSQIEWGTIDSASRRTQGYEKIDRESLNVSVPSDLSAETIISFHWWGNRSIVGVRRQGVFCPFSIELDAGDNKNYNHSGS